MNGTPARPLPETVNRAEADIIRNRTDQLIAQSLLLVGELRTRTHQLEHLVADLAERAAPPGGDLND
jgi:hypothetical protein